MMCQQNEANMTLLIQNRDMAYFDFLEYEQESLEGESVDNFNWGRM